MSDPIGEAALAALRGELVVLPTDTVYGIGTRPDDHEATARLFDAKGRPRDLELPVLVPTAAAAREIAELDVRAEALASRFWPGPLTLVLRRAGSSRDWDLGGDPATIGVRVPHHPLALAVLARTGPLAVTSANRSGEPTPSSCEGVVERVRRRRRRVPVRRGATGSGRLDGRRPCARSSEHPTGGRGVRGRGARRGRVGPSAWGRADRRVNSRLAWPPSWSFAPATCAGHPSPRRSFGPRWITGSARGRRRSPRQGPRGGKTPRRARARSRPPPSSGSTSGGIAGGTWRSSTCERRGSSWPWPPSTGRSSRLSCRAPGTGRSH